MKKILFQLLNVSFFTFLVCQLKHQWQKSTTSAFRGGQPCSVLLHWNKTPRFCFTFYRRTEEVELIIIIRAWRHCPLTLRASTYSKDRRNTQNLQSWAANISTRLFSQCQRKEVLRGWILFWTAMSRHKSALFYKSGPMWGSTDSGTLSQSWRNAHGSRPNSW